MPVLESTYKEKCSLRHHQGTDHSNRQKISSHPQETCIIEEERREIIARGEVRVKLHRLKSTEISTHYMLCRNWGIPYRRHDLTGVYYTGDMT
jgi:hypothetical protein